MPAGVDEASDRRTEKARVRVWDPLVRAGHWLLVAAFFVAFFTDDDLLTLHSWAGYGAGAYVVVRLFWGFVGPRHARFADFACGPVRAARYLRDLISFRAPRYVGHSPAGAMMVFALLVCLAATTVSGMALLAVEEGAGPLAPWLGRGAAVERFLPDLGASAAVAGARADEDAREDDEGDEARDDREDQDGDEILEELHELVSSLTLLLVVFHVGGVILASIAHRENLVGAMITGRKRAE